MTPSGCPVTPGFPIRRSPDQRLFDSYPRLFAAYHVLHRLSTPRHPPCTLTSLTTFMRGCPTKFKVQRAKIEKPARAFRTLNFALRTSRQHRSRKLPALEIPWNRAAALPE